MQEPKWNCECLDNKVNSFVYPKKERKHHLKSSLDGLNTNDSQFHLTWLRKYVILRNRVSRTERIVNYDSYISGKLVCSYTV